MTVTASASQAAKAEGTASPWIGFNTGLWQKEIDIRAFIQQNYEPYEGDAGFLSPATARTARIWNRLKALLLEERRKGVLDVSQIPASIIAHAPGYIDRDDKIIVGLQIDAPPKRAIMPNGGFRLMSPHSRLTATSRIRTSSRPSPSTARRTMTRSSMRTRPMSAGAAARTCSPVCPTPTAGAGSSAIPAVSPCTACPA